MTAHVYRCLCIRRRGNQPHTMDELIARLLVAHRLCMRRWARTSVLLLLALLLGCLGLSFFSLTSIRIAQDNASEMAALQPLKFLTVAARAQHTATVIFVHVRLPHLSKKASLTITRDLAMLQGLGDTGAGWQDVAELFARDSGLQHVKWFLPHA